MSLNSRVVLPLAGAVVLLGAVLGVVFWPEPASPPGASGPVRPEVAAPAEAPAVRAPPAPPPAAPAPTVRAPAPQAPPNATVVPIGPGDEVPEPESPNPLPQVNEPIAPEKPQTARWRLEKTERITALLTRDMARLEQARDAAAASGNAQERQRLEIIIRRQQDRLSKLREEISRLAAEAQLEPPEQ